MDGGVDVGERSMPAAAAAVGWSPSLFSTSASVASAMVLACNDLKFSS